VHARRHQRAAERLLAGVRDDVIQTDAGPVAATVTIGGVTAPRHARTVTKSSRARRRRSSAPRRSGAARSGLSAECRARRDCARRTCAPTDEIVAALNERRILLAFEPVVDGGDAGACILRMPDAHPRADGTLVPANDVIPVAERLGLVRLLDHACSNW
jgi:hypothetical protein